MTTTVLAFIPSPSQGVWHLFGVLPIRAYALCIIAGIVAALVIGDRRWEARGGERGVIYDIALWAVPFGLIGGRLYHVMTDWQKYFGADGAGFLAALRIWDGGLGIWGAVALGGVGAWIACRRRDIPLPAFGDAIAPGIILAQAIGRLGNYFNQELYGRETDLPWGLKIYDRLDPSGVVSPHSLDGVSTGQVYAVVHPTFLYELLWNLAIFAVLIWADRRFVLGHGRLFALYVAGYCVGRFWVELMRSDTATLIAGIRINTFTSTFVFIGAVIYIMVAPKGREDPSTLRGRDADRSPVDDVDQELVAVGAASGVVAAAKVAGDSDEGNDDGTGFTGGANTESEAAAETEDLIEQLQTAPSAEIAEGEAFAEAGAEADHEREAGLGSVEGDEAVEAEVGAPEAHEAAVEGAASAEAVASEAAESESVAAAEGSATSPEEGLGSVDGDEVAASQGDDAEVHEAALEGTASAEEAANEAATEETTAAPEDGLGSVESDEVAAAQGDAAEVHKAALEGTASAEDAASDAASEDPTEETTAAPEDGLGSVDGDEVAASQGDDAEVHEAAIGGSASAEAAAEETTAAPEDGLGAVGGDEVVAAQGDAAEVHDAAVEGTASAEDAASDAASEDPTEETTAAPEDGLGSVESDEVADAHSDAAEVHDAAVEGTASATDAASGEDPTAAPEDGLGAVDGDEVAAAQGDAAEVHDAAIEGTATAEAAASDAATADPHRHTRRWPGLRRPGAGGRRPRRRRRGARRGRRRLRIR